MLWFIHDTVEVPAIPHHTFVPVSLVNVDSHVLWWCVLVGVYLCDCEDILITCDCFNNVNSLMIKTTNRKFLYCTFTFQESKIIGNRTYCNVCRHFLFLSSECGVARLFLTWTQVSSGRTLTERCRQKIGLSGARVSQRTEHLQGWVCNTDPSPLISVFRGCVHWKSFLDVLKCVKFAAFLYFKTILTPNDATRAQKLRNIVIWYIIFISQCIAV